MSKRISISHFYFLIILSCSVNISYAATTILTDSDFPLNHIYVSGSSNTLHIQNANSVNISSNPLSNTGILTAEDSSTLIADGDINITNVGSPNVGSAVLIASGAKAYFNGNLTTQVAFAGSYALAITCPGCYKHYFCC